MRLYFLCFCSDISRQTIFVFFFKQKTAYELRMRDWSSDLCSSDLRTRLSRAMERRGFTVIAVESVREGLAAARATPPAYAIIDLRLADGSGLDVVGALRDARPDARIVMLTGYGNIATAVAAVKAGAIDYLPKQIGRAHV